MASASEVAAATVVTTTSAVVEAKISKKASEAVSIRNAKDAPTSLIDATIAYIKLSQKNNPVGFSALVNDCLEQHRMKPNETGKIWLPRSERWRSATEVGIIVLATCEYDTTLERYHLAIKISSLKELRK